MRIIPLAFTLCLGLLACSENPAAADTASSSSSLLSSSSKGQSKKAMSDTLFDDTRLRTYELLIDEDSLAKIDADPTAEEYVEARALIVGDDTIGPVGVRYKGNEGAWWGCTEQDQAGAKTCAKLSMKIKIDWKKDTTFFGLKKFQLHSMNGYPSQLRERVGYWFFRRMGVPAPRVVHARLKINGKEAGLFAHVENIDGRFVKYHYEEGSGSLYKELWPLYGKLAVTQAQMQKKLETSEDHPDHSLFQAFAQDLEKADSSSVRPVIEQWMDIGQILRLAAVSYALDDDDGPFHWYSGGTEAPAYPHNFYFYAEPKSQKIRMIPWDLDHMLDLVATPDTNNAVELRDGFGVISHGCADFGQGWPQKSAACDKLVAGWASYKTEYRAIQQELLQGPFQEINALLATGEGQLRPVTAEIYEANSLFLDPLDWENALSRLREELADAKARLESELRS